MEAKKRRIDIINLWRVPNWDSPTLFAGIFSPEHSTHCPSYARLTTIRTQPATARMIPSPRNRNWTPFSPEPRNSQQKDDRTASSRRSLAQSSCKRECSMSPSQGRNILLQSSPIPRSCNLPLQQVHGRGHIMHPEVLRHHKNEAPRVSRGFCDTERRLSVQSYQLGLPCQSRLQSSSDVGG